MTTTASVKSVSVGIDVSKKFLDVDCFPQRQPFRVPNTAEGHQQLIETLRLIAPRRIVFEGTGGYEFEMFLALTVAGLPAVRVNPRQVRDFARALGKLAKTDAIDETVLAQGREGLYDQFEVNRGLPVKALVAHFERAGVKWRVKEPLRRLIDFRKVNLIGPWGDLGKPDLVFIRNVLIYFDQPARRGVLERVAQILRPDGHLILGSSEVSHPLTGLFVAVDRASGTHSLASSVAPKA